MASGADSNWPLPFAAYHRGPGRTGRILLVKCSVEGMSNSRGSDVCSSLLMCLPASIVLLSYSMLPLLWLMSAVRLRLHWLMQLQRGQSLGAASTHLMNGFCFRITAKIICQSQAGWEFVPYEWRESILHRLHSRVGLQAWLHLQAFNSLWRAASIPWSQSFRFLQPLPLVAYRTARFAGGCRVRLHSHSQGNSLIAKAPSCSTETQIMIVFPTR